MAKKYSITIKEFILKKDQKETVFLQYKVKDKSKNSRLKWLVLFNHNEYQKTSKIT